MKFRRIAAGYSYESGENFVAAKRYARENTYHVFVEFGSRRFDFWAPYERHQVNGIGKLCQFLVQAADHGDAPSTLGKWRMEP